jgi:inactivated superfamily I helicase
MTKKARKNARGVKETVEKITEIVKKVPAWLKRLQAELKQLIDRLTKLDAMLDKLEGLVAEKMATKEDKPNLRLLKKLCKAMAAYKAVLEERLCKADASL